MRCATGRGRPGWAAWARPERRPFAWPTEQPARYPSSEQQVIDEDDAIVGEPQGVGSPPRAHPTAALPRFPHLGTVRSQPHRRP